MCNVAPCVSVVSIITEKITLRAIQDFDPKKMRHNERIELENLLRNQRRVEFKLKWSGWQWPMFDRQVNLYAAAIPFQTGDKMTTIPPAAIG